MSQLQKIVVYCVAGWLVALALALILPIPLISGFAGFLSLFVGFGLLILGLVSLVIDKDKLSAILAILLVVAVTWLALTKSVSWGARIHFLINRGTYEAKLARILSGKDDEERRKLCGQDCFILSGHQVSFHYVHGFLNWHDIVYDPTGAVMDRDYDKRQQINSYLVGAEHLSGDWYLGYFGD
ncbi:MAG: hypothetical protein ABR563_14620 [Pyrinomonadaceae bacterium]